MPAWAPVENKFPKRTLHRLLQRPFKKPVRNQQMPKQNHTLNHCASFNDSCILQMAQDETLGSLAQVPLLPGSPKTQIVINLTFTKRSTRTGRRPSRHQAPNT